jgi:hypothetical protein
MNHMPGHKLHFLFFWCGGTGVLNSDFVRQVFYCLSHISSSFYSGYFGDGVVLCAHAVLDLDPPVLCFLLSLR